VLYSVLAVGGGAFVGALLRWLLGNALNATFSSIHLGTLLANLIGGYLVGVAVGIFAHHPSIAPEWRLLLITGFLGGLTTFSAFSAEVAGLLQQGRLGWASAAIGMHVIGSLLMTFLGMATVTLLKRV